jgi:hypothetical protein
VVDEYLARIAPELARDPRYLDRSLDAIRAELESRPHYVYASRDRG